MGLVYINLACETFIIVLIIKYLIEYTFFSQTGQQVVETQQ